MHLKIKRISTPMFIGKRLILPTFKAELPLPILACAFPILGHSGFKTIFYRNFLGKLRKLLLGLFRPGSLLNTYTAHVTNLDDMTR